MELRLHDGSLVRDAPGETPEAQALGRARHPAKYRADIDGLRALAVLSVLFFHAGVPGFAGGYVGVDIFFVISGYLITSLIAGELERGTFRFIHFYERRARRILPALFAMMAATIPLAWAWLEPGDLQRYARSMVAVTLFSSNLQFIFESGYFNIETGLKPLLHTWSLSVEEQFYVLFPIALALVSRFARRATAGLLMAGLIVSLGLSEYTSRHFSALSFYSPPTRAWELLAGAWLAVRIDGGRGAQGSRYERWLALAGLMMIALAIGAFDDKTRHPGVWTVLPVLGTSLLLAFGEEKGAARRLLTWRPLVFVGLCSYSLYLWHHPIFAFARYRSVDEIGGLQRALLLLASFCVAVPSWRWVETPFRDPARVSAGMVLRLTVATAAVLAAFGTAVYWAQGVPSRVSPELLQRVREMVNPGFVQRDEQRRRCFDGDPENPCALGSSRATPAIALIGDSYAGQLVEPFGTELARRGLAGIVLTYGGCPFAPELERTSSGYGCLEHNRKTLEYLRRSSVSTVIVAGNYRGYLEKGLLERASGPASDSLEKGFSAGVEALLGSGIRVVLVYPIPEMGTNPKRLILNRGVAAVDAFGVELASFRAATRTITDEFDALGNRGALLRVDPTDWICPSGMCRAIAGGHFLYQDGFHLSSDGARLLMAQLMTKAADATFLDAPARQ